MVQEVVGSKPIFHPTKTKQPANEAVSFIDSNFYTKITRKKKNPYYKEPWLNDRGGDLSKPWYVGYRVKDQKTGNWKYPQKYISSKEFKTAEERYAEGKAMIEAIRQLLHDFFYKNKNSSSKNSILHDLQLAINQIKNNREKTTYNSYKSVLDHFIEWLYSNHLEDTPSQQINENILYEYFDGLGKVSAGYFNNRRSKLSALFSILVSRRIISHNPINSIHTRKITKKREAVWSATDLKNYLAFCRAERPQLYIASLMLFHVYIRIIELCRIQFKDIDLNNALVWVEVRKGESIRKEPGSLSKELINLLRPLKKQHRAEEYLFTGSHLVPGETATSTQRFGDQFREVRDLLKFENPDSIFYGLKHTGVSLMVANGVPLRQIQEQCRHTNISTTEGYVKRLQPVNNKHFFDFPEASTINY